MNLAHIRPVELAAATLVSVAILLVAIAPSLVAARPAPGPGLHAAGGHGIEFVHSPGSELV
jgi:hypothetical protein